MTDAINPQAPPTGVGARLLGRFQLVSAFWMRAAFQLARMPDFATTLMLYPTILVIWATCSGIRRTLGENAEWVHGRRLGWFARQRFALRTLAQFARCFAERNEWLLFARWGRFRHEFTGLENWEASGASHGAAILLTAHFGGWELGSLAPVAAAERRLHLVRERERSPQMQELFARALEAHGVRDYMTHFAGDPRLVLELLAGLRDGDLVALQGDRPRRDGQVLEVELLGRPYSLPLGPFLLAHLTSAPLLPVFNFRTGRRSYRMRICRPIFPRGKCDRATSLRELSRRYVEELESALGEAPEQWFRLGGATRGAGQPA